MSIDWEAQENRKSLQVKQIHFQSKIKSKYATPTIIQRVDNIKKPASIELGRFCKCGCGHRIPSDARKDRVFFNATCRRVHLNNVKGYSDSKNVLRARIRIDKPRILTVYPSKGIVFKIKITKDCKELWQFCNDMELKRDG